MNFATILARLEELGIPHAHHDFKDSEKNPAPSPPFINWFLTENARGPDCAPNCLVSVDGAVELYTDDPDEALERRLEATVLFDVEFRKFQAVIEKENMIQTAYEFSILEKRSMAI